jgi:diguanylate cyclase (GGDEF)-like protein/PAS domain S-box-containing protein
MVNLRESESRYRGIVERIPLVTYTAAPDEVSSTLYVSPQIEQLLGFPPEDFLSDPDLFAKQIHPEDRERVLEEIHRSHASGRPFRSEYRMLRRDGRVVWVHDEAYELHDENGKTLGIQGITQDITKRKEAEEKIRFQASLLDEVGEAVIAIDLEGKVVYWNRAAEGLYGWSAREAMGRPSIEVTASKELWERADEIMSELRAMRSWAGEYQLRRKDGTLFPALINVTPVHDKEGNLVGMTSVSTDITDRKRAEKALRESEQRFGSAFRDAAIGMALVGTDGRFLQVNRALCRIVGYSDEELLAKNFRDITHPDDLEADVEQVRKMLAGEIETYQKEKRYLHKEGHVVWILLSVSLVHDEEGEPLYSIAQIQDINERKRAEEALEKSEGRYRALTQNSSDIVTLLGTDGTVRYQSPSVERIIGYRPEEQVGENVFDYVHPEDLRRVRREFVRGLAGPDILPTVEYRFRHKDGSWIWLESVGSNLLGDPKVGEFVVNSRDVTERKALQERLKHQATHDLLTDLPNRQLLLDRLGQALRRTRRHPGHKVAVLFVDMDNFKMVNDSLGHEAGDRILVTVAERLKRCVRPEDTLSRFGGDEFVMLLENVRIPRDAIRVAERILEELRSPLVLEGAELVMRGSIGIALGDARSKGVGELLKDADTAMYRAKEDAAGYRIFEPNMHEQALRRLKAENDMRRAVGTGEFVVHYQPIADLRGGEMWGMEALVRWEHPERGLLAPSEFVAVAEETGLIVPIGERVLEEACHQAVQWQRERREASPLVVCVNLSARQLRRQDLAETVRGVLQSTGLDGSCLCLDITETLYITVLEGNTEALDDLRRMGVRISIDDFGMGYSSLAYLKRLPAGTLKIDKSFVAGLGQDVEDTAIVQMTINLAHTLGMRIIAEGVESKEQAEQLREMGCDLGQGYYFAEPLSPEALPEFLREELTMLDL